MTINGFKTTKTDNRDINQHRNYIKDLVNLLFCVDSEDFAQKITEKPYPKYQSQSHRSGPKPSLNGVNRVESSINQPTNPREALESLYEHHTHFRALKKGFCSFCTPKSSKSSKKQDLREENFSISIFRFDSNRNIKTERLKKSRRDRKRGKQTFWYCKQCEKHVCKEGNCWSQAHK